MKIEPIIRRFLAEDETWIYHYDPKSKQERLQWIEVGCSVPKRSRPKLSAKEVMSPGFWDAKRTILLIDYLEKMKQ